MGNVHRLRSKAYPLSTDFAPVHPVRALATSAALSLLFILVYGGCNWITSQRGDVGTFYFDAEGAIPFVPFFVIPYLTIDLFFVTAPFLCRSRRELRIFVRRVALAIVVAGICFLLFPLRFAFSRPHTSGWLGFIFDWFRGMDAPYNLLPSLHATLGLLLLELYLRHSRGLVRIAVIGWFTLIGISPLLTHQHHIADIAAGFALAGYCFYFVSDTEPVPGSGAYPRIGIFYLAGAAALFGPAVFFPAWAVYLTWPIVSLALVAAGYFGAGPRVFRKRQGRLPLSSYFVLGPCLVGQHLSLFYYRGRCDSWNEVSPSVWIGRRLNDGEACHAVAAGVTAVLDLSCEFSEAKAFLGTIYRNIPLLDLTAPTPPQLEEMAAFVAEEARRGKVYVHCKVGYSRSAAAIAAYLIRSGQAATAHEAFDVVRKVRPSVVIRPEIEAAMREFQTNPGCAVSSGVFVLASGPDEPQ